MVLVAIATCLEFAIKPNVHCVFSEVVSACLILALLRLVSFQVAD